MNQVTPESKSAVIKTLAILGFLAAIIFVVWLAVIIVRMLPGAFTQLANLAENVENGADEITIDEETIVANTDEIVTINFEGIGAEGSYSFTYTCADGVSVAMLDAEDSKEFISCDEEFELAGDAPVRLVVSSEKSRFADVHYTITFNPDARGENITAGGKLTIVNNTIPAGVASNDVTGEEDEEEEVTPTPSRPAPTPVTPKPGKPVTTITYVTKIPESDPKGFTDLAIAFISSKDIDADEDAKIQIEVKNLGTKTSKEFDVTLKLPEGVEKEIRNEKGLKPNERAIYTIEFDATDLQGTETIEGEVDVDGDTKSSNDSFKKTVRIDD
jgi:hypothetical protein